MPLSEGLVFAPAPHDSDSKHRFALLEAGSSQSVTLYAPRVAQRVAEERNLSDASVNASYRYGADLLGLSLQVGERIAVSLGLGMAPVLATDGNVTARLMGPYYLTLGAQINQPYGIVQRRVIHRNGYGLSAGVMYRRDLQWLGEFDPLNANRNIVQSDVVAGRILAEFPFQLNERSGQLRLSISVGPERRYETIVTRFGLGMVFSPKQ